MSAGPDRFDVAQFAADAAEWERLGHSDEACVTERWRDLRGELAEAAAPAAAHMALQVEEIAELRRRLEEERKIHASAKRQRESQLDGALAEIARLVEEGKLTSDLDREREMARSAQASNQAVTIRRLRFLTLRMAEIADGLDEDSRHTGDIGIARKEANDAKE